MTTAQECEAIARQAFATIDTHHLEDLEQYFAADSETVTMPTGERSLGPDGARRDTQRWVDAFPDLRFAVQSVVAGEDCAVLEVIVSGTHDGPLVMPDGTVPATGRRLSAPACIVLRFKDGLIVSEHDYFDLATFQTQLGLTEPPPADEELRASPS